MAYPLFLLLFFKKNVQYCLKSSDIDFGLFQVDILLYMFASTEVTDDGGGAQGLLESFHL